MSITQQTTHQSQIRDGVIAHGIMALGLHIAAYGLPAPVAIDVSAPDDPTSLKVRVAAVGDQQRWLNSVHIDSQVATPFDTYERITWFVRLPETGVQIQLVGSRGRGDDR